MVSARNRSASVADIDALATPLVPNVGSSPLPTRHSEPPSTTIADPGGDQVTPTATATTSPIASVIRTDRIAMQPPVARSPAARIRVP